MKKLERRLLGVFADPHDVADAGASLQKLGECEVEIYSPVPDHHLMDISPPRWKPVRYFTMFGALCGLASGFALALWTASLFELFLSGMTWDAIVPFVIIGFEVIDDQDSFNQVLADLIPICRIFNEEMITHHIVIMGCFFIQACKPYVVVMVDTNSIAGHLRIHIITRFLGIDP